MGTLLLRDQNVWFDAYNLTTRLNSVGIEYGAEVLDDTTLGDDTRSGKGGLKTAAMSVAGLYDADPYDEVLFDNVGVVNKPFSVGASSSEGSTAYFINSMVGSYVPFQNSVGDLAGFDAGGMTTKSPLVRGLVVANELTVTSSGEGTAFQLGAMSATQTLYVATHVLTVDPSTDPSLALVFQTASSSGFSSPNNRITFTEFDDLGSEFASYSNSTGNTDTWGRIVWTPDSTDSAFDFVAVAGIV